MVWKGQNDNWICLVVQSESKNISGVSLILIYRKENASRVGEVSCSVQENTALAAANSLSQDGMLVIEFFQQGFQFTNKVLNLELRYQDRTDNIRLIPPQKGVIITAD